MGKLNYVLFTYIGYGLPIAKKLQDEGNQVIVCLLNHIEIDVDSGTSGKEETEAEKRRKSLYDGLLNKQRLPDVLKTLSKIEHKDDWFIIFDFNSLYKISDQVLALGFTKGLFPSKDDFESEKDRHASKAFIEKNCPNIKIGNVREFKNTKEGIDFLQNEGDGIYALKSEGNYADTIVPHTNNPEFAKNELMFSLKKNEKDWNKGGFILEDKITNAIEIVPQVIFWNGKPIASSISMETRLIGAGEVGFQTGGNQTCIIAVEMDSKIIKWTVPKAVYKLADKHKGLFVYDCSLLFDTNGTPHFGEFCGNRWGWGDIFAELTMSDGPSAYFEAVSEGRNPLKYKYGTYIGFYNIQCDKEHAGLYKQGLPIQWSKGLEPYLYPYQIKKYEDGEDIVNTGYGELMIGYTTGRGNTFEEAVDFLYKKFLGNISFYGLVFRPKEDYLTKSFPSSLPNRIEFIEKYDLIKIPEKMGEEFTIQDGCFIIDSERFAQYKYSKRATNKFESYIGDDMIGSTIKQYAVDNPTKPVILKDQITNATLYLRYGRKN